MKKIKLRGKRGGLALVDDKDFKHLNQFAWSQSAPGYACYYSYCRVTKTKRVILQHRYITNARKGLEVDHINGNKLDNRRSNLRVCTRRTNATNSGKRYPRGKYGRNVVKFTTYWRAKPYMVGCWHYNKRIHGGYFATVEEAQEAARKLRRKLRYVEE